MSIYTQALADSDCGKLWISWDAAAFMHHFLIVLLCGGAKVQEATDEQHFMHAASSL